MKIKLFEESIHFCIVCKNSTVHILVDGEWICIAHEYSVETEEYWNNELDKR
jgi:hypothetical protein